MNKLLLIIDPQIDFISGSLPVPDAEPAMDALAKYINEHGHEYSQIVITADWHTNRNRSFAENGGSWPRHCVQYSEGAAIWPAVLNAANEANASAMVLTKGLRNTVEEYSIFQNANSAKRLERIIREKEIARIDLCGLAGDVCVLNTMIDAVKLYGKEMVNVLEQFSPSLDGGVKLSQAISKA